MSKTSVHFSLAYSVALIFHSQDLKVNSLSVFLRYSFYLSSKTLVPKCSLIDAFLSSRYPCAFNSCGIVRRNSISSTPGSDRVKRYSSTQHYVV